MAFLASLLFFASGFFFCKYRADFMFLVLTLKKVYFQYEGFSDTYFTDASTLLWIQHLPIARVKFL
jgi:hypothetical protein